MFVLLIGFITPAIVFAIFGIIACLRRSSMAETDEEKVYQLLESRVPVRFELSRRPEACVSLHLTTPVGYQHLFAAPTVELPPSYSEATSIPQLIDVLPDTSVAAEKCSPTNPTKHIPPNQPRIRPLPQAPSRECVVVGF